MLLPRSIEAWLAYEETISLLLELSVLEDVSLSGYTSSGFPDAPSKRAVRGVFGASAAVDVVVITPE